MASVDTWTEVSGEGDDYLGTWYTPTSFWIYVPADTPKSPWTSLVFPRQIKHAGGMGLGSSGDTDPFGGTSKDILWWGWIQFERHVFSFYSPFVGGDTVFWKLPPLLSVWYFIGV